MNSCHTCESIPNLSQITNCSICEKTYCMKCIKIMLQNNLKLSKEQPPKTLQQTMSEFQQLKDSDKWLCFSCQKKCKCKHCTGIFNASSIEKALLGKSGNIKQIKRDINQYDEKCLKQLPIFKNFQSAKSFKNQYYQNYFMNKALIYSKTPIKSDNQVIKPPPPIIQNMENINTELKKMIFPNMDVNVSSNPKINLIRGDQQSTSTSDKYLAEKNNKKIQKTQGEKQRQQIIILQSDQEQEVVQQSAKKEPMQIQQVEKKQILIEQQNVAQQNKKASDSVIQSLNETKYENQKAENKEENMQQLKKESIVGKQVNKQSKKIQEQNMRQVTPSKQVNAQMPSIQNANIVEQKQNTTVRPLEKPKSN